MRETHYEGRSGVYGWLAIGAFVVAFDCFSEESLTHAAKRGLENPVSRLPVITGIGLTALHLLQIIPESCDPFYRLIDRDRHYQAGLQ